MKAIVRAGVGTDNIDKDAATRHGIVVMNTPGGNTLSTAEHTIALMLALSRNIAPAYESLKGGKWERNKYMGTQVAGKTLGIVGLGRIGVAVAKRARALEMNVLGFDPFTVVKTLIMEDEKARPLVVLMHGNRTVSTKNLARQIGAKSVEPCKPEVANRHSGYLVGGTSPFGTRKAMPVYVEESILALPRIVLNGGRRGYLVGIAPQVLPKLLGAKPVNCALDQG